MAELSERAQRQIDLEIKAASPLKLTQIPCPMQDRQHGGRIFGNKVDEPVTPHHDLSDVGRVDLRDHTTTFGEGR